MTLRKYFLCCCPWPFLLPVSSVRSWQKLPSIPVDRIIKTVQKITAENLKLRIQMPGTRDEIERLAATFNDMLDRLEKAFSSQKHFIQDASHELKTPLTILQGELEVTPEKNPPGY